MVTAHAITIYPNRIVVQGAPGAKASAQIKIYGHPENVSVEFVKVDDLRSVTDTILTTFDLGQEQQRVIPIDIIVDTKTKEYYLCAVLKKSQSMRLRVCCAVKAIANTP